MPERANNSPVLVCLKLGCGKDSMNLNDITCKIDRPVFWVSGVVGAGFLDRVYEF
jgi:hypothetical protein